MLTAYTQTLLTIRNTTILYRCIAENNILKLIHASIGKHQCRIILYHHRSRRNYFMPLPFEKLQKSPPYLIYCHHKPKMIIHKYFYLMGKDNKYVAVLGT